MKTKKQLDNGTYFGLSGTSEYLQYTWEELQNYILGQIVISIGNGTFQATTKYMLRIACAWALYQEDKKK